MKLRYFLIPLLVLSLSTVILQDSFAQSIEPSEYRNYDIIRNVQNGTEYINSDTRQYVYESTYPRVMIDNEWIEHRHEVTDDIVKWESFIGSLIYDKNSCSYTLYENEQITPESEAVLPSVSWVARTAPMNTDNWVNLDELNNLPCVVEVEQTDMGIKITATKELLGESHDVLIKELRNGKEPIYEESQTTEVVDGVTYDLINTQYVTTNNGIDWYYKHYYVDIETVTTNTLFKSEHVLDLNYKNGIKESFLVYNYDPSYDFDKFTGTQTIHTDNILTIGNNSFDISQLDGSNFNRDWVLENKAQIFEIAENLKYDFSVSISQLYNISIIFDEVLGGKISMDFANIDKHTPVGTAMEIDPTTTYGGGNNTNLGTFGAGIVITATVKGGQGGGGMYDSTGSSSGQKNIGGYGGTVVATFTSTGTADIIVDVGEGGRCSYGTSGCSSGASGSGVAGGANNGAGGSQGRNGGHGGGMSFVEGDGEGKFIIAGGGGGTGRNCGSGGGHGGGSSGNSGIGNGSGCGTGGAQNTGVGGGGTQSSGGSAGNRGASAGGYLYGGTSGCDNGNDCGGGGGSGYYGGGGGGQTNNYGCGCLGAGGGGGSSYVKTSYLDSVSTNSKGSNGQNNFNGIALDGSITIAYTLPDPPADVTDLAVSTQTVANQLTLTWTNADTGNTDGTQPTGYKIERSVDNVSWSTIETNTGNDTESYTNTGLTPNQIYYYRVTAIGLGGEATNPSNVASETTWNVPAQVTGLTGTSGASPTLNWSAPSSDGAITNYKIYRQGVLHDTVGNVLTYSDSTSVTSGSTYSYAVSAVSAVGEGAQSSSVNVVAGVPPDPPSNVQAVISDPNNSPLDVTVTYTTPSNVGTGTLTGFQLLRNGTAVSSVGLVNTISDTAPSGGQVFTYTVKSLSTHGSSSASSGSSVTTPNTPDQVTGLTVTPVSTSRIDLSWNTPSDNNSQISGYKVQISSNGGVSYTDILTGNVNTVYQALSLNTNSQYHFKVSAINAVGTGTASDVKNTYTMTPTPATLTATPVSEVQIDLAWGNSTGAIGYKIDFESPVDNGFTTLVNNTGTTDLTYSVTGLTTATQYNFKVSAWNNGGTSQSSPEASAYTWGILQAPVIDSVSRLSPTSLKVDWTAGAGLPVATGYKIERQLGSGWTIIANNTGTTDVTYTDSSLPEADQVASYRIYAINTIGTSPASNEVSSEVIASGGGGGGGGGSTSTAVSSQTGVSSLTDLTYIDQIHRVVLGQLLSKSINVAWDSSNNLEVKSIIVSDSPFRIVFQEVPFVLLGDPSGISNGKINYSVQIPNEFCTQQGQINCVEQRQYDIPVEIQTVHKGSTLTKTSVIKIDLTSSSDIPLIFVLLAIVAVPVAFIIRKVGKGSSRRKASGSSRKSSKNGSNSKKVSL